jgi:hypothetical protein
MQQLKMFSSLSRRLAKYFLQNSHQIIYKQNVKKA